MNLKYVEAFGIVWLISVTACFLMIFLIWGGNKVTICELNRLVWTVECVGSVLGLIVGFKVLMQLVK